MGRQASRLVGQLLRGTVPADPPVETTEVFLSINLRAAEAIGLDVSDEILQQDDTIVYQDGNHDREV